MNYTYFCPFYEKIVEETHASEEDFRAEMIKKAIVFVGRISDASFPNTQLESRIDVFPYDSQKLTYESYSRIFVNDANFLKPLFSRQHVIFFAVEEKAGKGFILDCSVYEYFGERISFKLGDGIFSLSDLHELIFVKDDISFMEHIPRLLQDQIAGAISRLHKRKAFIPNMKDIFSVKDDVVYLTSFEETSERICPPVTH